MENWEGNKVERLSLVRALQRTTMGAIKIRFLLVSLLLRGTLRNEERMAKQKKEGGIQSMVSIRKVRNREIG